MRYLEYNAATACYAAGKITDLRGVNASNRLFFAENYAIISIDGHKSPGSLVKNAIKLAHKINFFGKKY